MRIEQSGSILPEVQRGHPIQIQVDGKPIDAFEGETIAAAMLTAGILTFRLSRKNREPRGFYCGMGVCFECLVTVDGTHAVQACLTPVREGMQIETRRELEL